VITGQDFEVMTQLDPDLTKVNAIGRIGWVISVK
jgi:hypothetical protein